MAARGNRKRKKNTNAEDKSRSPWGSLFQDAEEGENSLKHSFFARPHNDYDDSEEDDDADKLPFLRRLWKSFSVWSSLAVVIFISFTATLFIFWFAYGVRRI